MGKRLKILAYITLLFVSFPFYSSGETTLSLKRLGELSLGDWSGVPLFAVSDEGTIYYLQPRSGHLRVFLPSGEMIEVKSFGLSPESSSPPLSAISSKSGLLYGSASERIDVYDSRGQFRGSINTNFGPLKSIQVDFKGFIYGLRLADGKTIHKFSPDGKRIASFGEAYGGDNELANLTYAYVSVFALDEARGQIIYIPAYPYQFQVFDLDGNLIRKVDRNDPSFATPRYQKLPVGVRPLPSDMVAYVSVLNNGFVVTQVRRAYPRSDGGFTYDGYLELFDENLNFVGKVSTMGIGVLVGKDGDDNLYFAAKAPSPRLTKARLVLTGRGQRISSK